MHYTSKSKYSSNNPRIACPDFREVGGVILLFISNGARIIQQRLSPKIDSIMIYTSKSKYSRINPPLRGVKGGVLPAGRAISKQ